MSLATKYRPKFLKDVLGNDDVIKSLWAMMEREEIPHTLLLPAPAVVVKRLWPGSWFLV